MEKRGTRGTRNGSNGKYRLSGTEHSYANRQAARSRKGKRPKKNKAVPIAVGTLILAAVLVGTVWGVRQIGKKATPSEESSQAIVVETLLNTTVKVDDIDISGMSRQEAHDVILKNYEWAMTASYNGEKYEIKNIIEEQLNDILNEIFSGSPKESYTIQFTGLDALIEAEVAEIAAKWDVKAKNASLSGFNKETTEFVYADGTDGVEVNQDLLKQAIAKAIEEKNFKTDIPVESKITKPEIASKEQVKEMYKVIGTFTTTTTSNKDRNTNISLASTAIDGMILAPGEEFSFNSTTGNRTLEKGYKPAGAYVNGKLVEEPGGGVCQVSSTLYNAVVASGLNTTERHAHSFVPSYIQAGEDAMVSYDGYAGPDMKFVNSSNVSIVLRSKLVDQKLTISIVGIPILAENEKVYMSSKQVGEYDEPAPTYEDDASLAAGEEVVVSKGSKGSRWATNLVRKQGDTIVSDTLLHYSTYRGKSAIVKKNLALSGEAVEGSDLSTVSGESAESTEATSETVTAKTGTETAVESKQSTTAKTTAKETTKAASTVPAGPGAETTEAAPTTAAPTTEDMTIAPNPGN